MSKFFAAVAILGGAVLSAIPASAHHSVTGIFQTSRSDTLEGRLVKVDWINPHIYFHLDVTGSDGAVTHWRFESLPPAFMRRAGLTAELMMDDGGKPVKMLFNPPRDPANKTGFALEITYADGHSYRIGNIPSGNAPAGNGG